MQTGLVSEDRLGRACQIDSRHSRIRTLLKAGSPTSDKIAVEMKHFILMLVQKDVLGSIHPDQPIIILPRIILPVLCDI